MGSLQSSCMCNGRRPNTCGNLVCVVRLRASSQQQFSWSDLLFMLTSFEPLRDKMMPVSLATLVLMICHDYTQHLKSIILERQMLLSKDSMGGVKMMNPPCSGYIIPPFRVGKASEWLFHQFTWMIYVWIVVKIWVRDVKINIKDWWQWRPRSCAGIDYSDPRMAGMTSILCWRWRLQSCDGGDDPDFCDGWPWPWFCYGSNDPDPVMVVPIWRR